MRAFCITVVFFVAFIAVGNALVCEHCFDRNSSTCTGVNKTCADYVSTCEHSVVRLDFAGSSPWFQVFKGCSAKPCQEIHVTKSTIGFSNGLRRVCCKGNLCNCGVIPVPTKNSTPNGRACPACLVQNSYDCPPIEMLNCTGEEVNCVDCSGVIDLKGGEPFTIRVAGCINIDNCNPSPVYPEEVVPDGLNMTCKNAKKYCD